MSAVDDRIKDAVRQHLEFPFSQTDEGMVVNVVKYGELGYGVHAHYNGRYLGATNVYGTADSPDALGRILDLAEMYFSNPKYQCPTAPASPIITIACFEEDVEICTVNAKEFTDVMREEIKLLFAPKKDDTADAN